LSAIYGAAGAGGGGGEARAPAPRPPPGRAGVTGGKKPGGGPRQNPRGADSGKTPIVEYLARLLVREGERPAVLTRGYARRAVRDGVTIVSDGTRVLADLDTAGDEPLMLARALPGVPVLVGADRHLSGTIAERRLGATLHLLDDGFQHVELERDVDLLLVSEEDLGDRPLPAGRLRERLEAAAAADAVLVTAGYDSAAERIGRAVGVSTVFRVARAIGAPRRITGARDSVVVPPASRVFVVAGIARPDRFVADVASAGWEISGALEFRDHYPATSSGSRARRARGARPSS
jgi:tetraacyldisaccharide 4'-kinase